MPRPTLRQIAREAGVSLSTASYALRKHANASAAVQKRVCEIASKLNYVSDPRITSLMAHIRNARQPEARETLALIWPEQNKDNVTSEAILQWVRKGVFQRAEQLGFSIQEFWPHQEHMPLARLLNVLFARSIHGLIFAMSVAPPNGLKDADFSRIAVAKIGFAEWPLHFHQSAHNHFMGITQAMRSITAAGFLRPALLLRQHVHALNFGAYEAAFRQQHPCRTTANGRRRIERLIFLRDTSNELNKVRQWLFREQPDVLICSDNEPWPVSMARHMPDIPCASLLRMPNSRIAGIDQQYPLIAANAVDLIMEQLNHNKRGVPFVPKTILTDGAWFGWT